MVALALTSCASKTAEGPQVLSGVYSTDGFEYANFVPEGSDETWTVHGDMSNVVPKGNFPLRCGKATITVRGTVGPPGTYGHLGCCVRVLKVDQVLEVHDAKACPY